MRRTATLLLLIAVASAISASASIFGSVRGIVHDPHHRPIVGATVTLQSATSQWSQSAQTDQEGAFSIPAVPIGAYQISVSQQGFDMVTQTLNVASGSDGILHFELKVAGVQETVNVSAQPEEVNVESATPTTTIDRQEVARTPGADQTNSLTMITDYVPGAYMTHDQLHIRGGHQVSWLIDGVPVPNTNIASNVGPQFDPKDIDTLEVQRGSYDAEYGDRTYGVFNVVPRTGFERNNEAELITTAGNFYQTNDQFNFGSHSNRLAYYLSFNGNRSNLGLETPTGEILHDQENGFGGFGSLVFNVDPSNQLRLVSSARRDFYQVPNTPEQELAGIHDAEHESDAFANFSWVHTINSTTLLTVSPFYHFNRADYAGGPDDFPISASDNHSSGYAGGQATLGFSVARNDAQIGIYGFGQRDRQLFGVRFNDHSSPNFEDRETPDGGLESAFLEDKFRATSWLTLMGGLRQTHFDGAISEDAVDPRVGGAVRLPRINWVLHGFYGHFYQAPPLVTASGPLLQFVTNQSLGFVPLHGERDEEHQFGVTIPLRGWTVDADNFRTRAANFFDHSSVGNSNIFLPLTISGALIRGWELTLRSPRLWHTAQLHLAYSNQIAQGRGAITGGLTDFSPPALGYFLLDHDQRNTLNTGVDLTLPWRMWAGSNVYYGSGFANGDPPPDHLPGHTTFDLSVGKEFGERFAVSLNALNVANRHLLIDNSETFGGLHYNDPRQIYAEFRYRFKY